MKKKWIAVIFCCMTALWGNDPDWQVPDAEFRLIVESDRPAENSYLNFGDYALPTLLGKGIDVRDPDGNKVPFYLHQTLGLLLAPVPNSERRYIYFGLPQTAQPDQWSETLGGVPPDHTLYWSIYGQWHQYRTGKEWLAHQTRSLEIRFQRSNAWMCKYLQQSIMLGAISPEQSFLWQPVRDKRAEPVVDTDWNGAFDREDYKCWRHADRVRRLTSFSDREMKNSYREPYRFSRARVDWAWRRLYLSRKAIFKVLPDLETRAPDAPFKEFTNMFKPPHRNPSYTGNQLFFHMSGGAFSARRNLSAVVEGRLVVPEDGEYEIKIETAGSFILYLEDEQKLSKYNEPGEGKSLKVNLKAGLVKLKLCFHRPDLSALTVLWKKPGSDDFTVLSWDDFAPAWPCRPVAMQERERGDMPLLREHIQYDFFTGKNEKLEWRDISVISRPEAEEPSTVTWLVNGVPVFAGRRTPLILKKDDLFGAMTGSYPPVRLLWLREYKGDKPWLHAEVDLKAHLPDFIYDDEELQLFIEVSSGLPVESRSILSVTPGSANSMFASAEREIVIPARREMQEGAYAADGTFKYPVLLKGRELKGGLEVTFSLRAPGLTFAERRLRFIPADRLPGLALDAAGNFRDDSGAWVVPVLHRPTLNELRSWELPVKIKNHVMAKSRMLFIGDDPGGFKEELERALNGKKLELTFIDWSRQGAPLSRMRHDFPALLSAIPQCRADVAVIVPAADDLLGNIPPRSQARQLGALLQVLRANSNIQTIYLCTPVPIPGREAAEAALTEKLYRLARDFGVEVINLNHLLRMEAADDMAGLCRLIVREAVR
jgi:hypothetical protein